MIGEIQPSDVFEQLAKVERACIDRLGNLTQ
jgi:hypothetical protein